ncbi:MAG: IS481 family transposase [Spirochaetes bacterium]|nr:MAG: IS481 family transposase [Spirochaetota bacterium]
MDREKKEKIGVFRFGVIFPLIDPTNNNWGAKEAALRILANKRWEIPYSDRSFISRATILNWLKRYQDGGANIEALFPLEREDRGRPRSINKETLASLIQLRKDNPGLTIPALIKKAKASKIIIGETVSSQTVYRLLKQHGLSLRKRNEDLRKFEVQFANDLWQSDCMHGPKITHKGKLCKTYLFAIIDDHSRLITHGQFYLAETLDNYLDCLWQALEKRGLPRKLYVDNGPSFRSHRLQLGCASLQIALIYAKPYRPQGKGKIERFFRTVRMQFLPTLPDSLSLSDLNELFYDYLDQSYHTRKHGSTGETPLHRYEKDIHLLRGVMDSLPDYFRKLAYRTVRNDRTVQLEGRVYQAPIGLIGEKVMLRYESHERVEVFLEENVSEGFLTPIDLVINSSVKRNDEPSKGNKGGQLFMGSK